MPPKKEEKKEEKKEPGPLKTYATEEDYLKKAREVLAELENSASTGGKDDKGKAPAKEKGKEKTSKRARSRLAQV